MEPAFLRRLGGPSNTIGSTSKIVTMASFLMSIAPALCWLSETLLLAIVADVPPNGPGPALGPPIDRMPPPTSMSLNTLIKNPRPTR